MDLIAEVKHYEWGKLGSNSTVAQLAQRNRDRTSEIDHKLPYAELWMGTHPSGPCKLKENGNDLRTIVKDLPYLFKVLSIRKALSIQVHPTKEHAEQLNIEYPQLYQDSNHKPEIAIALTSFVAMCGFRPYKEIAQFCDDLPPLMDLVGGRDPVERMLCGCGKDLRVCYENLMTAEEPRVKRCIEEIGKKYSHVLKNNNIFDVFKTLNKDYPNDVGVLSLFFLNVLTLKPGEAIYLPAGEIHAYLSGDCVECMACSDNVIRAGLTPKYKDVKQLLACLNYEGKPAQEKMFQPRVINENFRMFIPPVEDFAVIELSFENIGSSFSFQIPETGCIFITVQGRRQMKLRGDITKILERGSILYIPPEAGVQAEILPMPSYRETFLAYAAMPNIKVNETSE